MKESIWRSKDFKASDRLIEACSEASTQVQELCVLGLTKAKWNEEGQWIAEIRKEELQRIFQDNSKSLYEAVKNACDARVQGESDLLSLRMHLQNKRSAENETMNIVHQAEFKDETLRISFNPRIKDDILLG